MTVEKMMELLSDAGGAWSLTFHPGHVKFVAAYLHYVENQDCVWYHLFTGADSSNLTLILLTMLSVLEYRKTYGIWPNEDHTSLLEKAAFKQLAA